MAEIENCNNNMGITLHYCHCIVSQLVCQGHCGVSEGSSQGHCGVSEGGSQEHNGATERGCCRGC